jgi:acetoin utilization protein AcuB
MRENGINCLPVLDGGKLVGIVTDSDLFDSLIELLGGRTASHRFVIRVDDVPGVLAKLASIVCGMGANISHMARYDTADGSTEMLIKTSQNVDSSDIRNAFEEAGFTVLSAEK